MDRFYLYFRRDDLFVFRFFIFSTRRSFCFLIECNQHVQLAGGFLCRGVVHEQQLSRSSNQQTNSRLAVASSPGYFSRNILKLEITTLAIQATLCKIPTQIQSVGTQLSCGAF